MAKQQLTSYWENYWGTPDPTDPNNPASDPNTQFLDPAQQALGNPDTVTAVQSVLGGGSPVDLKFPQFQIETALGGMSNRVPGGQSSRRGTPGIGGGGEGGGSSGPISGYTLPRGGSTDAAYSFLVQRGLSPIAAAGIVGNLQQESNVNPEEAGGGIAQWIGSRYRSDLQTGNPTADLATQLNYLWSELSGQYGPTLAQLKTAQTPAQAADIFSNQYERPGVPMLGNRESYAQQIFNRGVPVHPPQLAPPPAPSIYNLIDTGQRTNARIQ